MFKLKYRVISGSVEEVEFEDYLDMVAFVAEKKIPDDDVVSITIFGEEMSLFGLADKVADQIRAYKTANNAALDVDELDWEDGEEDEDYDESPSFDPEDINSQVNEIFQSIGMN